MSKKNVYFSKYIDEEGIIIKPNENVYLNEEEQEFCHRFSITIPFLGRSEDNGKHAIIILKNPSKAGKLDQNKKRLSDDTIYKVLDYLYKHEMNFAKVTILNLFSIYGSTFRDIALNIENLKELSVYENDQVIYEMIKNYNFQKDIIIVAWGGYPNIYDGRGEKKIGKEKKGEIRTIYNERIKKIEKMLKDIQVYTVGNLIKGGFPSHAKNWYDYEELIIYEKKL